MHLRRAALTALLAVVTIGAATACDKLTVKTTGEAVDVNTDEVAGLEVTHFESGLAEGAPTPGLDVENGSGSHEDTLAIATIADVSEYWTETMRADFGMEFDHVARLISYDSSADHIKLCGGDVHGLVNAFYCPPEDAIAWDRGQLFPTLVKIYGDLAPVTVMAHEYGHAVQHKLGEKAGITSTTKTIVSELQADCFTGSYFRWVVEGKGQYFKVSTAEGLNAALSTLYHVRDGAGRLAGEQGAHGTSFDRTLAFQEGFSSGAKKCASYQEQMLRDRTTQFKADADDKQRGDSTIDEKTLNYVKESLDATFQLAEAPSVATTGGACGGGGGTAPASYCPDDNTVSVDLAALAQIGEPIDRQAESEGRGGQGRGDFAAWATVASRYALAVQKASGVPIDDAKAGLRTACLVGSWASKAQNPDKQSTPVIRLSPGDVDEAILEMLQPKSLIASNVQGEPVPSGFLRVEAFRKGFLDGKDTCGTSYR